MERERGRERERERDEVESMREIQGLGLYILHEGPQAGTQHQKQLY